MVLTPFAAAWAAKSGTTPVAFNAPSIVNGVYDECKSIGDGGDVAPDAPTKSEIAINRVDTIPICFDKTVLLLLRNNFLLFF